MDANPKNRHVVLIFGEPNQGKSYLADQLHENYGYKVISLDAAYVEFIRSQYPDLYFPLLSKVIAPHFMYILRPLAQMGKITNALSAWRDHVISLASKASLRHQLVAVEGYLLGPILGAVQERLADVAATTIVEVRQRQYFVVGNIEQISATIDGPIVD